MAARVKARLLSLLALHVDKAGVTLSASLRRVQTS
jgi:hypothetical protein